MDAEAIRLIITAAAAVVAGLGSAGLTGYFNRKNTTATLTAARQTNEDQWSRTREREHEVWLRDNRQEAYVAFFDEAETHHARVSLWPQEEIPYESFAKLQAHRARIKIVGSPEIRFEARELALALGSVLVARNRLYKVRSGFNGEDLKAEREMEKVAVDDWKSKLTKVRVALASFVTAVRADLGTGTAREEALPNYLGDSG